MSTDSSVTSRPDVDKFAPYNEAEDALRREISRCDDLEEKAILTWKLASFYLETARPEKAVAHLRWVVDTTRSEERRDAALRMLRFLFGCPEPEVPVYDNELDLPALLWDMGNAFLERGNQQPGLLCLLRLLDISSDQEKRAECFLQLGVECEKTDEYNMAIDLYRRGIECGPKEVRTLYFLHNNFGYCLNRLAQHDEAEHMCRVAIEIDPRRHNAYKNLGVALQGQGQYPEAAACFLLAAHMAPPDNRSVQHLEKLLASHREEVERESLDIMKHLEEVKDSRHKMIQ